MEQNTKKKAVLAVSFGTSYKEAREAAIGGIERALAEAFSGYEIRRCFTSGMVIAHILKDEGIQVDNPQAALQKAAQDHVAELLVQPTHVMAGFEHQKFLDVLGQYQSCFETIRIGTPLLAEPSDYQAVMDGICAETKEWDDGKTAVILVGHGSDSEADRVYAALQQTLRLSGHENYYVGTIESRPSARDLCVSIREKDYSRIVLLPLMVVAGDHAANDICGPRDSWKQIFELEGYEVIAVLKGLGEYPAIQDLYVQHLKRAEGGKKES